MVCCANWELAEEEGTEADCGKAKDVVEFALCGRGCVEVQAGAEGWEEGWKEGWEEGWEEGWTVEGVELNVCVRSWDGADEAG